jgi:hypothetical protein
MKSVFLVQHEYQDEDENEEVKLIGIYATEEKAKLAVERSKILPGFCDYPDGFSIAQIEIDVDHWTTGFVRQ